MSFLLALVIETVLDRLLFDYEDEREHEHENNSHTHYLIPAIDVDDLAGNGCRPVAGEKNSRGA
jgi:hypothetical protein